MTTFSIHADTADFTAKDIRPSVDRNRFTIVGNAQIGRVSFSMPGEFSVANAMAAGVTALLLGLDMQQVCDGLSSCPGIPGRTEVLHTDTDFTVIRDYAHTPDGLEKVLPALKPFVKNRLMVLVWMSRGEGSIQTGSYGRSSGKVRGLYHSNFG